MSSLSSPPSSAFLPAAPLPALSPPFSVPPHHRTNVLHPRRPPRSSGMTRTATTLCVSRQEQHAPNPFSAALAVLSTLLQRRPAESSTSSQSVQADQLPPAAPAAPATPTAPADPPESLDTDGLAERLAARADDDGLKTRLAARRHRAELAAAAAASKPQSPTPPFAPRAQPKQPPAKTPGSARPSPQPPQRGTQEKPRRPSRRSRHRSQLPTPAYPALAHIPPARLHMLIASSLTSARARAASPLATPLPYDVQRRLFDELRTWSPSDEAGEEERRSEGGGWAGAAMRTLGDLFRLPTARFGFVARDAEAIGPQGSDAGPGLPGDVGEAVAAAPAVATAAYTAAAVARDQTASIEPDAEGRSAAAAFAAAAAMATSASAAARRLDSAERAGLCAAVSAARAVANTDDAIVFIDTVGVAPLVTAAALLDGPEGAAALTALANIAIVLPKARSDMLASGAGGAPLGDTIRDIVFRRGRFGPSQHVGVGGDASYTEALVSGTHLLGSLVLTKGEVGTDFRVTMATDKQLVKRLQRLAGGLKNGEPEGAARAARRALGTLGVNTWRPRVPGQRGLRILSIDGGGTRAIMAFEMLKELKKATGCEIHELFDVIGGTSTGAIVAASIGIVHKSVEEVELLYRDMIGKVFAKHPVNGPKMLLTRAYYDTSVLETTLQNECGRGVFIDSLADENMNRVFVVSSIMSRDPKELHVFRNYTYPLGHESRYDGTAEAQLWEGLRASSAAPTFFSEIRVNGELHADGAIVANNPTAVALHEAKCMFPGVPVELIVSLGNGVSPAHQQSEEDEKRNMGWGDVVGSIVASATSTETVHYAMLDLFPKDKYFRFNPTTDSTQIDETSPETLAQFVKEAQQFIQGKTDEFATVAQILRPKTPRSLFRRFRDALRKEIQELENSASHDDLYLP